MKRHTLSRQVNACMHACTHQHHGRLVVPRVPRQDPELAAVRDLALARARRPFGHEEGRSLPPLADVAVRAGARRAEAREEPARRRQVELCGCACVAGHGRLSTHYWRAWLFVLSPHTQS